MKLSHTVNAYPQLLSEYTVSRSLLVIYFHKCFWESAFYPNAEIHTHGNVYRTSCNLYSSHVGCRAAGYLYSCLLKDYIKKCSAPLLFGLYTISSVKHCAELKKILILSRFSDSSRVLLLLTYYVTCSAPLNRMCFASNN